MGDKFSVYHSNKLAKAQIVVLVACAGLLVPVASVGATNYIQEIIQTWVSIVE